MSFIVIKSTPLEVSRKKTPTTSPQTVASGGQTTTQAPQATMNGLNANQFTNGAGATPLPNPDPRPLPPAATRPLPVKPTIPKKPLPMPTTKQSSQKSKSSMRYSQSFLN